MDATLSSRLPTEMFYSVCYIYFLAIDSSVLESPIQQFPGWSNERPALQIFLIARLLAYKHYFCVGRALAKNGLRATFP